MKVRVPRNYWYKIIDHYQNIIFEKFLNVPLTPFVQYQIMILFEKTHNEAKKRETHPAWHIPLLIKFNTSNHTFLVEPEKSEDIELC